MPTDVQTWLLDSDPTLAWQVQRDLLHEQPEVWEATRARIPAEGFGARLLDAQDDTGMWANGAYFPGGFFELSEDERGPGQPWTATTWSLTTLRDWGMDPAPLVERRTAELLDQNARWEYDNLPYWGGETDCCINAMTLSNGLWLGADVDTLPDWFVEHQQPDGGWNCEWVEGSERSSVHSTLNSLKGLLDHQVSTGSTAARQARHVGEEYLLERGLVRRRSTGERLGPWVDHFTYPFRHVASAMHGLEYFRRAAAVDGIEPDPRLAEAVDMVRSARQSDGTWLRGEVYPGAVWFDVDEPEGQPSKWLTLHGQRILDWWDAG